MTMLISLVVLYVLVVLLLILFSGRILITGTEAVTTDLLFFGSVAIIFPLVLLVAIGISIYRLVQDRRAGKPGSTFKSRLATFFVIVISLSTVPQGIVSVGFISSSLGVILSTDTADALRDGLRIALLYYDSQIQAHNSLHNEHFWQKRAGFVSSNPEQLWDELTERLPSASSLQVFGEGGETILTFGDESLFSSYQVATELRIGSATRTSNDQMSFLRSTDWVDVPDGRYLFVMTSRLPTGFDRSAERLTRSVGLFEDLEELRPTFVMTVSTFYFVLASPLFLLSILVSFFLSDQVMRPIESLEEATRRIAQGDFSVRVFTRAGDDLGLLLMSFNKMVLELERSRRRLARTEKVAAWREIAQRFAHEVKNPLTPIRLAAERLQRKYQQGSDDFPRVLERTTETIIHEVDALTSMLNEFRSFSRLPEPNFQTASLRDSLEKVARVFKDQPGVAIDYSAVSQEILLPLDTGQIRQVWMNLFTNAVEANDGVVTISIFTDLVIRGQGEYCRIRIEDNGPGIPEEIRDRIFDPYFTTKPTGTGLGLAIVERIVYDHHGQIWIESAEKSGTSMFIDLPLEQV